jgi:hypothetical protein
MRDDDAITRYPLAWPVGWRRTPAIARVAAPFRRGGVRLAVPDALTRLDVELGRLGARAPTLSTNVNLRLDGRIRGDETPADPGVAVYFAFKGKAIALAADRFLRVADNVAAIAGHIEAIRRIERYGIGTIEQAMAGYRALPADTAADWRAVFGFAPTAALTLADVDAAYRTAARRLHPDAGGSDVGMAHINRAREYARQELNGGTP